MPSTIHVFHNYITVFIIFQLHSLIYLHQCSSSQCRVVDLMRGAPCSETVDSYAQVLNKLFYCACPIMQQGSLEAESMGWTVLTCQFMAGLLNEIKNKVAGMNGEFEQLVASAHFEGAKVKDLGSQEYLM